MVSPSNFSINQLLQGKKFHTEYLALKSFEVHCKVDFSTLVMPHKISMVEVIYSVGKDVVCKI